MTGRSLAVTWLYHIYKVTYGQLQLEDSRARWASEVLFNITVGILYTYATIWTQSFTYLHISAGIARAISPNVVSTVYRVLSLRQ